MKSAHRRVLAFALAFAALLAGAPGHGQTIANPDLFEKSFEAARQALEHYGSYDDPAAMRRVADIGYQLAMQSGFEDVPFTFFLIDMPVPNAFALPGGQIFVTRGMLDLGLSDDMLANLIGHEIAHVTRRHGTRLQKKALLLNVLSQALLLGVLIGVEDDNQVARDGTYRQGDSRKGNMIQGAMATGVVVSELLLRSNSRDFEDEADEEGQRLAAAGGFDPAGASQLWDLMNARLPTSRAYGYWRTHPFSDDRLRAGEARARELKVLEPKPDQDYRAKTQKVLLGYRPKLNAKPSPFDDRDRDDDGRDGPRDSRRAQVEDEAEKLSSLEARQRFLDRAALTAWPVGREAEQLRRARLHDLRDRQAAKKVPVNRDYGEVVRAYLEEIDEVRLLTPDTSFLATLEQELADLRVKSTELYPAALEVWRSEVYETPFLETFLSNFPTVKEAPDVALALGNAYSRVGRQTDAVRQYLRAAAADPDGEAAAQAQRGLRTLTPRLDRLAALEEIGRQTDDPELRDLASRRLDELDDKYTDIEIGAEYLSRFPDGDHADAVQTRLDTLAQNLYGEVLLFQAVGDSVKALERIQLILTHAPLSEAAERLREKAVVDA